MSLEGRSCSENAHNVGAKDGAWRMRGYMREDKAEPLNLETAYRRRPGHAPT
jgi:hypothetical protein